MKISKFFKNGNCCVFGLRGTGKDLVFQKVINERKKENYFSNIDYGFNYHHFKLNELSISPNNFKDLVNDKYHQLVKNELMENSDIYISDSGIYFACQNDNILHKTFPTAPLYIALSRHLYNQNIHVNIQNCERLFKPIREQVDYFILTRRTIKIFGLFFVSCYIYDNYNDACLKLKPLKRSLKKDSLTIVENSKRGEIYKKTFCIRKKKIKYDTRIFHNYFFGTSAS